MDGDGGVEVRANNQNEPPTLLDQQTRPAGGWIVLKLEGTKSNRSAIGARVAITAGGRKQVRGVRSGASCLSQRGLRLHFGLGAVRSVEKDEIRWPNGGSQTETRLAAGRVHSVRER